MDIRRLIFDDISGSGRGSASTRQKKRECLNALDRYVGEGIPVDCLRLMSTGWLDAFERHLLSGRRDGKALSRSTAAYMKRTLVSYCRTAIKRGLCPNIRIMPEDGEDYGREIESLAAPDWKRDMGRLLSSFHLGMERCKAGDVSGDAQARTRGAGYAALGVLLCGVGYSGLSRLLRDEPQANVVRLPHLDVDIELPQHILAMLEWLRSNSPRKSAPAIEAEAHGTLAYVSLSSAEGFTEPFAQWIGMALDAGYAAADARRLIDRLFSKVDNRQALALAQSAFDTVVAGLRNFSYSWYCVRSSLKGGAELSGGAELLRSIESEANVHPIDSFCPRLRVVSDRGGRKEVRKDRLWDSLLLVKANAPQIEAINRHLMSGRLGFIYGLPGKCGMEFSRIRDGEIDLIRSFFEDRDSHSATGGGDLAGRKVQVKTGLYEGYDGTIVKVEFDNDRNISRLILKLQGASANVTYRVDPEYVRLA